MKYGPPLHHFFTKLVTAKYHCFQLMRRTKDAKIRTRLNFKL